MAIARGENVRHATCKPNDSIIIMPLVQSISTFTTRPRLANAGRGQLESTPIDWLARVVEIGRFVAATRSNEVAYHRWNYSSD
jgi:hypothetical protein